MAANYASRKRTTLLILLVLTIISVQVGWWIVLSQDQNLNYEILQERFLQPYPAFLRTPRSITFINLLAALICWLGSLWILIRSPRETWGWVGCIWSTVLLIWLGFSLA
jgi:hypothetical protein